MPDSQDWKEAVAPVVRVAQIIIGALIVGCLVFGVIASVQAGAVGVQPGRVPRLLTYVAIAFAATALLARAVVGSMITASGRRRIAEGTWSPPAQGGPVNQRLIDEIGDPARLAALFLTRTIVLGALLEGPAFFLLVAHLIEGTLESLIGAAVMLLGLVLSFPTHGRMVSWIEEQLGEIERQRQFQGR
jgi:hypothetical protein